MHSVFTKKLLSLLLFSTLITLSVPVYGMWDTLQLLLEKSKKLDAVKLSVGAVAVGSLACCVYLGQQEIASKEQLIRSYEAYMHGISFYTIETRQGDIMIRQVLSKTSSLQEQHADCVLLARHFGNESMRLKAAIKKKSEQKKLSKSSIDSPMQRFQRDTGV